MARKNLDSNDAAEPRPRGLSPVPDLSTYRGYRLSRDHSHPWRHWEFTHLEYDGPEDDRHGHAPTIADCRREIDERLEDGLVRAALEVVEPGNERLRSSIDKLAAAVRAYEVTP